MSNSGTNGFSLGNALGYLGKYNEAIKYFAEAWNNKGVELGILKRYKDAIGCFDKALQIDPNYTSPG